MNEPPGDRSGKRRDVLLTFAVAVTPARDAADLDFRRRMLAATLASLFAQTDGAFRVMIACDTPAVIDFPPDPRLEIVPFRSRSRKSRRGAHRDQAARMFAMARRMAARGGGYFMPVDMDDFVSRDLVAFVRAHPDPNGYIIEKGYALDGVSNRAAPIYDVGAPAGPFHKACGTCAIINLAPADVFHRFLGIPLPFPLLSVIFYHLRKWRLTASPRLRYFRLRQEGHYMMAEAAEAEHRPLKPIPFRAAVYTAFHGANLSLRMKGAATNDRRLRRMEIIRREGFPASRIAAEFTLPATYPLPAGVAGTNAPG
jgi:hypothetical protein